MKKSELKVGEEYALGGRSEFDSRKRATLVGMTEQVVIPSGWQGKDERTVTGPVFVLHEDEQPWPFAPSGLKNSKHDRRRVLMENAAAVRSTWADFAAAQQAKAEKTAAQEQRRAEKRAQLARGMIALRDAVGFDIEALSRRTDSSTRYSASSFDVTIAADDLVQLVEQIRGPELKAGEVPLALAGSAGKALRYVEQTRGVKVGDFELHELNRLMSIAQDAEGRARELRDALSMVEHEQRTGEPF